MSFNLYIPSESSTQVLTLSIGKKVSIATLKVQWRRWNAGTESYQVCEWIIENCASHRFFTHKVNDKNYEGGFATYLYLGIDSEEDRVLFKLRFG